ncbi:MAG TPA: ferritin-like domain-containing protein [Polyangiaceae bacterium]|nr:ferritin-like domain-containing protein [Polyangiaceae bacterium]
MQHVDTLVETLHSGGTTALRSERVERKPRPKRPRTPLVLLGLAAAVFLLTFTAEVWFGHTRAAVRWIGIPGFGLSTLLALAGAVSGLANLWRGQNVASGPLGAVMNVMLGFLGLAMAAFGALTTLLASADFARGRQLRRLGRVLLPPVVAGADWVDTTLALDGEVHAPPGVGEQWRENGRTEHASVASFARLTLDLMALGAPPSLVTSANQDALDEIRHTEACFALAHALDGKEESPGAFPEAQRVSTLSRVRSVALAELAVLSLIDGALHEGVSARIIAKLARRAQHPKIIAILKQIAADEGRHAAHGWDVVEWCLAEGGKPVAHALAGAVRVLPKRMQESLPEPALNGGWEPWGIHSAALQRKEFAAARADVVQRVARLIAPSRAA